MVNANARYNPRALNEMIVFSERSDDILKICFEYGSSFNYVNVATAMHRLAKLNLKEKMTPSLKFLSVIDEMAVKAIRLAWLPQKREV